MSNIWAKNNLGEGKKTGRKLGVILKILGIYPKYDQMIKIKYGTY